MVPVPGGGAAPATSATGLVETLVRMHGEAARPRAERGVKQLAAFCARRRRRGGAAAVRHPEFIADPGGARPHPRPAGRGVWRQRTVTSWKSPAPGVPARTSSAAPSSIDGLLAATDPGAHLQEDLFASKIAFTVLLNWPLDTLDVMVGQPAGRGPGGQRPGSGRFATRPSGAALAERAEASSAAEAYIAGYNLWVHHPWAPEGSDLFPSGKRLLSHWNLRDQIKADYAEGQRPASSASVCSARPSSAS
jgi:hypothetical protein